AAPALQPSRPKGLPVSGVQRRAKQRRPHGFSNPGVGAGHKEVFIHALAAPEVSTHRSRHAPSALLSRSRSLEEISQVSDSRNLACPSGTVGGRIARTANPFP